MEEAMGSVPEPGSGGVKHLVRAFESMLSISKEKESEQAEESRQKVLNWEMPGLQQPIKVPGTVGNSFVSVFSSGDFLSSKDFERDSGSYSSMDSSNCDRLSLGSRTSGGGRRSRRNSTDSSGRSWNKKLKVTSQQPFKLRTKVLFNAVLENACSELEAWMSAMDSSSRNIGEMLDRLTLIETDLNEVVLFIM